MSKPYFYLSLDLEGMSGFRSNAEHDRNLDILRRHANACIAGISRTVDTTVKVKSFHGKLPGGLPANAEPVYSAGREDFDLPQLDAACRGLFLLGFHGLEPECGFGHSYRWPYLILNGNRVGEITIQILLAATSGVPTLFFAGDEFGLKEAQSLVPGIAGFALRPGLRMDEGDVDQKLVDKITTEAAKAAQVKAPVPPIESRYRIEVPMRKEAEADEAEKLPFALERKGSTIIYQANDFRAVYRFLMVDLWQACGRAL